MHTTDRQRGSAAPRSDFGRPLPAEHSLSLRLQEIETLIAAVVASWQTGRSLDGRKWHRAALERTIAVTPLDDAGERVIGPSRVANARDVSPGGIAFTHRQVLPFRHVAVTFRHAPGEVQCVAVRLQWCRFTSDGTYKSGGKFLRLLPDDLAPADWEALPPA
jgi:hypothetical protein